MLLKLGIVCLILLLTTVGSVLGNVLTLAVGLRLFAGGQPETMDETPAKAPVVNYVSSQPTLPGFTLT